MAKKILLICGSINQTRQMHRISEELPEHECYFAPYFADGFLEVARKLGLLEFTILGNKLGGRCLEYLHEHELAVDFHGRSHAYDLVLTCSDLIVPRIVRHTPTILVQEGMTDPENLLYSIARRIRLLPRWIASTSTTGLSHAYAYFCVASEGYRDLFIRKGIAPNKLVVTGMPNFDNCRVYENNSFPYHNFVLVCTSDTRETFKLENRKQFILNAVRIAHGRQLIFKLHPNENARRATREINRYAPGAMVFASGCAEEMVANCDVLITRFSTLAYVGLALEKETYSDFDLKDLRRLLPLQHRCGARNIAAMCRSLLEEADAAQREYAERVTHDDHARELPSDCIPEAATGGGV